MANVRWKDKAAIVVAAGDKIPITDITDSTDKHVTPALLAAFTLDGKTIGDGTAGAIVTIDAAQTLTQKRLNSPGINSATAITATSAEINKLAGVTATTAEINKLAGLTPSTVELNFVDGVTSAIQTQLNALAAQMITITKQVFTYGVNSTTGAGVTTKTITAATILADLGLTGYLINPQSVIATVYTNPSAGVYNSVDIGTSIRVNTSTSAGVERVNDIVFSGLTAATAYSHVIHYTLIADPT